MDKTHTKRAIPFVILTIMGIMLAEKTIQMNRTIAAILLICALSTAIVAGAEIYAGYQMSKEDEGK